MCSEPIDGPLYLVTGTQRHGRRWSGGQFGICTGCYTTGGPDPETGLTKLASLRETKDFHWQDLVGRGKPLPAAECAGCGRLVVRAADPLLKRVTCSRTCSTSLTRTRNGNQGSGQPCEGCGNAITTGRADSRYCGSACRQKAYRKRQTAPVTATVTTPPRRRKPQAKNITVGLAALSGMTESLRRVELDDTISAEQARIWEADLAASLVDIRVLAAKLKRHAQQQP